MNTLAELEIETLEQTTVLSQLPLDPESDSAARKLVNGALSKPAPPPTPLHRTAAGTPYSSSWSKSWIARVTQTETRLQRRICGARLPDGSPCELESHHESGRCRMHGGFNLTGAPVGNSNAAIHGLYARRLKTCGPHCPMWNECPCAGADVAALEPVKRPICPYEQAEYDSAVAVALESAKKSDSATPEQDAHTLALLQVMTTRASLAVRNEPLALEVGFVSKGKFCQTGTKLNAHFQAFTRIVAEYRRFTAVLKPRKNSRATLTSDDMALLHLSATQIPEAPESPSITAAPSVAFVPLVPCVPSPPSPPSPPSVPSAHNVHEITEPSRSPRTAQPHESPPNLPQPTHEVRDLLAPTVPLDSVTRHNPPV